MYISKRTLARRLEREGGYRQIREKLLAEMAARHLQESGLSVEAVAALLGYNDAAAFHKAFRRWYGQSPGQFRRMTNA
jgi:AraC-like DNA-binding protein